jgi:(2R)-3-sulfolactate dehydrogenase (NADP+)
MARPKTASLLPAHQQPCSAPIRSLRSSRVATGHPFIDMSLSEVARGELMVDADEGQGIPLGWALDKRGNPAADPKAGLEGSMLPAGGVNGAMLAPGGSNCWSRRSPAHGWASRSAHSLSMKGINPGSARLFGHRPGALAGSEDYNARINPPAFGHAAGRKCTPTRLSRRDLAHRNRAGGPGNF